MQPILVQTRVNGFQSIRTLVLFGIALLIANAVSAEEPATDATEPTLKVAVVSPRCVFADVNANLSHFTKFIEQAAKQDARLVCFPELALVSYSNNKDVLKVAEEIPGPSTRKLEVIAERLNIYISMGMAEREDDRHYIAQILVGPEGYLGKYRKNHVTEGERTCGFLPGKTFPTWNIDGFRFGILICFDGRHQNTIEAMKKAHVDVIHHPHGNWVGTLGREAEEWTGKKAAYFVPRAITARAHILINNSAEDTIQPHGNEQYSSGALVIDPLGQIVNRTKQKDRIEKMIFVTLKMPQALIPIGEQKSLMDDAIFKERFK